MKNYHRIIERLHLIDPRPSDSPKEQYEEWRKELQLCHSPAWMKNGGLILWNAFAICETLKTSWRMGKLSTKDDSEDHSSDRSCHLGAMVEYHPISTRGQSRLHQFGKKVLPGIFLEADIEELEIWKRQTSIPEDWMRKEVLITQRDGEFVFPAADDSAELSGRDYEFQEPTPRRNKPRRREFQLETHWSRENLERRYFDCWSRRVRESGRITNLSTTSQRKRSMCIDREWNLERRYSDSRHWRIGKFGRIRKISKKTECEKKSW